MSMKLINLKVKNVMRVEAVEITPDGNLVILSGRNAQGKSAVLESIWLALGGAAAAKGVSDPVRHGADSAEVELDLGELVVKRTWKEDGETELVVRSAGGARIPRQQSVLDQLLGPLSFDPLAFMDKTAKEQRLALAELLNLPIDLEAVAADIKQNYDERTIVGRRVKSLKGQIDGMTEAPEGLPTNEISQAAVLAEQRAALEEKSRQDRVTLLLHQREAEIGLARDQVAELQRKIAELETRIEDWELDCTKIDDQIAEFKPIDLGKFETRLQIAEETNALIRAEHDRQIVVSQLDDAQKEYDGYTSLIDGITEARRLAIDAAEMPIEGLSLEEDGVYFNGVPLGQASGAEGVRVSMGIAMAMNPNLKIICIKDGNRLDNEGLAIIAEMAEAGDYTVFVERVVSYGDDADGFIIEGGLLVDQVPAAP